MNIQKINNRSYILNKRPIGTPTLDDFKLVQSPVPVPNKGQILLKTRYLSLDPYMRGRMSDRKSYTKTMEVGDVMMGETVSVVEESLHSDYQKGDLILSHTGWQEYSISDGSRLRKVNGLDHPSYALGILGMPGFTGYYGLTQIGKPQPRETVVVAAASGAVGSVVGQTAKILGAHVVGIAGGQEKCDYVVNTLGFDQCIDHRHPDFAQNLKTALPYGIDVYFESVGGAVFEAVLPLLNPFARVPVCGLISQYNDTELPDGKNHLRQLTGTILTQRMLMQGFIISEHYETHFDEFYQTMSEWVQQGKVKFKEDIIKGFENAPQAFIGLLAGKNFGKLVIEI